MKTLLTLGLCAFAAPLANAQTLQASATYSLPTQLGSGGSNFHPQGLGIDEDTGRLLYAQMGVQAIYSTDLTGSNMQLVASTGLNHTTSVAGWDGDLVMSDYTSVTSGQDMWRMTPPNGSVNPYGTDIIAYGAFPIDIRNGELYRTNHATAYNWGGLNQMMVFDANAPNGGRRTFSISGSNGIGDFAVDLDTNSIWVLEYAASAQIHRYDINTTARLETYTAVGDGLDAGLTYYNGNLYYYDWVTNNSTLTVFPTGFVAGCTDGMDPFDLDNNGEDETCIHPTAIIEDNVTIEPGARIHANVVIAPRATIGSGAEVFAGAVISRRADIQGTVGADVVVGRDVLVSAGSTVGDDSVLGYDVTIDNSDLGPQTTVGALATIEEGSNVGDDGGSGLVVVARGTTVQGATTIDSGSVIGPDSTLDGADIGSLVRIRKDVTFQTGSAAGDSARVGRSVQVGANADIAANANIGALSTLSDNACASGVVARGTDINTCP